MSVDQLISVLQSIDKTNFKNETERSKAHNAIFATLRRVQTPWEIAQQHIWGDPATITIIKILIDVDFWRKWVQAGGASSTSTELAIIMDIDPTLLSMPFAF